ncbi:leucyl aminopeptidase family protein [Pseudoalteromonas denitrificans]|uniref:Leucyl aminopeptidase n=1 Tax=Pseudoalteromonas denitrificans DSM 6059 TaxID=1123010 RepID=A0A1I1FF83_9GAMM|nr:leucyl aminopeptidase family protein [Pseudoalteromonas denitrificans]SFB98025.1 leucyl aminopeptidase [Pseudoalteromonas denitrificans DSM 6059]
MTHLFVFGNTGTPLVILPTSEFDTWKTKQTPFIQSWLNSTSFNGKGLTLLPDNTTGEVAQAIFFTEDVNGYWQCGDLVSLLPKGNYVFQGSEDHRRLVAFGWALGAYQFDSYKTHSKDVAKLVIPSEQELQEHINLIQGVVYVRDLVNTPACDMMPQHLAEIMQDLAHNFSGSFSQWIGDELLEQNYPTIHMVGRASEHKPRLIELNWGNENAPKVTLVGKGVCFDSGGLDLKPGAGMRLMKKDMGGAAHVIGLAHLIMAFKLPVRLRVLIPAVENAVSNNAFRPGDVIKTRKGLTVEIDNTDAEGRLVLCDALTEAQNDSPDLLVDFATLTGACRVALGTELPGFFTNNDAVAAGLIQAGKNVEDNVWQLPLYSPYKDMLKSDIADLSNCAQSGFGGAITAALYLQEFVEPTTPWVHFDVMAWNNRKLPGRPLGGEAFGIRAMFDYIRTRYTSDV